MTLEEMKEASKDQQLMLPLVSHGPYGMGASATNHIIHLMDPVTGTVERRRMGPDSHLGGVED